MKEFRCSCGNRVFWGSGESPKPCIVCKDCGTTLLKRLDGSYVDSEPHKWTTEETYLDGELVHSRTYCKRCYETKPEEKK
mgnify:CR=1 FL=1